MKKIFFAIAILTSLFFMRIVLAKPIDEPSLEKTIQQAIKDIVDDNKAFTESKHEKHFEGFLDIQNPRVTLVTCSDSRVQIDNFSNGAENDIFVARNIGNQFITTQGSVEYGVNVLKTPVLLFIGHSHCGAVKAAMSDTTEIPSAIRKELDTIDVKAAKDDKEGVIINVHYQVDKALATFKSKVDENKLAIIGAIYDFRNDFGRGFGQLIIVNLNGNKNPKDIKDSHYFDNLQHVVVGVK